MVTELYGPYGEVNTAKTDDSIDELAELSKKLENMNSKALKILAGSERNSEFAEAVKREYDWLRGESDEAVPGLGDSEAASRYLKTFTEEYGQ